MRVVRMPRYTEDLHIKCAACGALIGCARGELRQLHAEPGKVYLTCPRPECEAITKLSEADLSNFQVKGGADGEAEG